MAVRRSCMLFRIVRALMFSAGAGACKDARERLWEGGVDLVGTLADPGVLITWWTVSSSAKAIAAILF